MIAECLDWQKGQSGGVTPELPFFSHTSTVTTDATKLCVIGGKDARGKGTAAVRLLEPATMRWSFPKIEGHAPVFLYGHSTCRVGNTFHLVGGYDQSGLCSHTYRIDLDLQHGTAPPHPTRSLLTLYKEKATWSVPRFVPAECKDEGEVKKAPFKRVGHALVRRGTELLLFGGHDGNQWCNDLHSLDTGLFSIILVAPSG